VSICKEISQNVNDVIATGRIRNFPTTDDINDQGNLMHRDFLEYRLGSKVTAFRRGFYLFSKIRSNEDFVSTETNTNEIPVHMFMFVCKYVILRNKLNFKDCS
jgi:hypothetical protein